VDDESEDKNNESSEQQGVTFVDPTRPAKYVLLFYVFIWEWKLSSLYRPMPAPLRDNSPVDEKMRARASVSVLQVCIVSLLYIFVYIQGFDEKLCRQRALEELVSSLFFPPFVA